MTDVGEDQPAERACAKALWLEAASPGGADNTSVRCSGMLGVRGTQEPVSGLRYRVGRVISGCPWEERVQEHRKEGRVCAGSRRAPVGEAGVRGRDRSRGPGRLGLGLRRERRPWGC